MNRIYIAAPLATALRVRGIAAVARSAGYDVTSTWHDTVASDAQDPTDHAQRADVLATCLTELSQAYICLALMDHGRPRSTLAEVGWHLGQGKPVVWSGVGVSIFDAHRLVTRACDEHDIWRALQEVCARVGRRPSSLGSSEDVAMDAGGTWA